MPTAAQMKAGRVIFARFAAQANGASTPADLAKLLTVEIGDGNTAEFQDPTAPPDIDTDDTALRGTLLGSKSNATIAFLVRAPGTGAIVFDGEEFDVSGSPTSIVLYTWLFGVGDAIGQWREVLWKFSVSGAAAWKLHPVGSVAGWQTKTGQEERPVKFMLEF